jgi:hypothetical protein
MLQGLALGDFGGFDSLRLDDERAFFGKSEDASLSVVSA